MKNILLISLLLSVSSLLTAQTEEFTKKDWKKFNTSFVENLTAAKSFYSGNIDYENKNKFNFMPTSKVNLYKSMGNSINEMGYTSHYSYDFKTIEEAKTFYNLLKEKLELPITHEIKEEGDLFYVDSKKDKGLNSSAKVEIYDLTVLVQFTPPLDVNIPLDVK